MKYLLIFIPVIFFFFSGITQPTLLNDIKYLSSDSMKGRKVGTPENHTAALFIAERFRSLKLKSYTKDYLDSFSFTNRNNEQINGANVLAYIPGNTDSVIVISAHFDHLGIKNGEVYNGADDNASGTAGLLSLAAYFSEHKPKHTLLFAAFDAEEQGLIGSDAFVAHSPVPLQKIIIDLNMDMISHNDKGELYVCGTFKYPQLKQYVVADYKSAKLLTGHDDPKLGNDDWTNQSDQGSFAKKNIPFLYFGVEDHKDYHKPTDDFKNINKVFFTDAVEAIKQTALNIDKYL
jgi:Zn-dependent M28 family amino/carboxypeptidase